MIFDGKQWIRKDFSGSWSGSKATGLPSKQNPNVKM
jgi:hypothetical protein